MACATPTTSAIDGGIIPFRTYCPHLLPEWKLGAGAGFRDRPIGVNVEKVECTATQNPHTRPLADQGAPMTAPRVRARMLPHPPLRPLLAAAGAGALAFGLPGVASATEVGGGWAGYVASSSTYTSVTATWTQPAVKCGSSSTAVVATWVGLDGYTSDSVEQIGTEAACGSGSVDYLAWYELYPDYTVDLAKTVSPGDSITATVTATSSTEFTLKIADLTRAWTYSTVQADSSAKRSSAEVVVEVPTELPTADSGSVTFSGVEINGEDLGAADPTKISSTYVSCGSLVDGADFSCTWE
jgi:Peptidase A4 family